MKFPFNLGFGKKTEKKSDVSLPKASDGYSLFRSPQGFIYAFKNFSIQEIINNYQKIAPLAAAVDKLANAAASLPITLTDVDNSEKKEKHPAFRLLSYPNSEYQKVRPALIRSLVSWKIMSGNAYLMVTLSTNKMPLELYCLHSSNVNLNIDSSTGFASELTYTGNHVIETYKKNTSDGAYYSANGRRKIIHIANFNPVAGDLEGLSELKALAGELSQYLYATEHNNSLLQNGALPSGAFVIKDDKNSTATLSEEEFERLKRQIENEYTGAANAGRVLLLEGNLEWQPMSLSPKDMDFETLKMQAEEQIYKKLDIPVQLISSKQTTAGNTSNLRLEFYQNRVIPMLDEILSHMNKDILSMYKDAAEQNLKFVVDKEEIDVLAELRIKKRESVEKSTTLTINEKRAIYKLPPIEGGNVIVDPNGRHIVGPDAIMTVGQSDASKAGGNNTNTGA